MNFQRAKFAWVGNPACGSQVRLSEPVFIPRAEARGFYREVLRTSFRASSVCLVGIVRGFPLQKTQMARNA
jgi:hypothetical protein